MKVNLPAQLFYIYGKYGIVWYYLDKQGVIKYLPQEGACLSPCANGNRRIIYSLTLLSEGKQWFRIRFWILQNTSLIVNVIHELWNQAISREEK